jgi:DNA-binding beta-propeller fold protein YncE
MLTVRGRASAAGGISAVYVNDVAASSQDGFATWTARVWIADGCNILRAAAVDSRGQRNEGAATVAVRNRGGALLHVGALELDAAHERLISVGPYDDSVTTIDLDTGRARVLSGPANEPSGAYRGSHAVLVDRTHNRALLNSWGSDALLAIDLDTGARSVLVAEQPSASLSIQFLTGLALDSTGSVVFALNQGAIIAIDLLTGQRYVAASDLPGSSPSLMGGVDLVYDAITNPAAPRFLVSVPASGAILEIDPSTGRRAVLEGSGPALIHPSHMKLDTQQRRLLVTDGESMAAGTSNDLGNRNALIAIDLSTGARSTVASASAGMHDHLAHAFALAFDARSERAYVASKTHGQITVLDLPSGTTGILTDSNVGSGKRLLLPAGLSLAGESLLLVDQVRNTLVRIALRTGDRSEVSGLGVGIGPELNAPAALVLDEPITDPNRALTIGLIDSALVAVDLRTGGRTRLSLPSTTATSSVGSPGLALDAANGRVLFTDATSGLERVLSAIDLTTGARSVVSGPTRGSGPALIGASGLLLDVHASPPRALAIAGTSIFAVDLASGNRSVLSAQGMPVGVGMLQGALDPQGQRLLVSDWSHGVIGIDLASGRRELLVPSEALGKGPILRPSAVAVDFANAIAYVADELRHGISAVDLSSGERVIVSH